MALLGKSQNEVKIAVLEQKLVDFTKYVSKLDDAIDKLSEVSTNLAKMLVVHDEKLEQCNKVDDALHREFDELKKQNSEEHLKTFDKINTIEKQVLDLNKFKWSALAVVAFVVLAANVTVGLFSGRFSQKSSVNSTVYERIK